MDTSAIRNSAVANTKESRANRIPPPELLLVADPRAGHVIRNRIENSFDLTDFAVLDLEKLENKETEGTIERRPDGADGTIHQSVLPQRAVVIEKGRHENHLALLVHHEAAIAAARDDLEHPGLELRLASHSLHRASLRIRIIRRDRSILHALAIGI